MRQWHVNPSFLCDKHLLGEHVEHHMFCGCLLKNKSLKGYIEKGLVEIHTLISRHNELVLEMNKRGMNHQSPLNESLIEPLLKQEGHVNRLANIKELHSRCQKCKEKIEKVYFFEE